MNTLCIAGWKALRQHDSCGRVRFDWRNDAQRPQYSHASKAVANPRPGCKRRRRRSLTDCTRKYGTLACGTNAHHAKSSAIAVTAGSAGPCVTRKMITLSMVLMPSAIIRHHSPPRSCPRRSRRGARRGRSAPSPAAAAR